MQIIFLAKRQTLCVNLICIFFFFEIWSCFAQVSPYPIVTYQQEYIEIRNYIDQKIETVQFLSSNDQDSGTSYKNKYSGTLRKMNLNLPNKYQFFCSWKSFSFLHTTQSNGLSLYLTQFFSHTATNFQVNFVASKQTYFYSIKVNIVFIHQSLVTNSLMYGQQFVIKTGTFPAPQLCDGSGGPIDCTYPQTTATIFQPGFRLFTSIRSIEMYRMDDTTKRFKFNVNHRIATTGIDVIVSVGNGIITSVIYTIIAISEDLFDHTLKKRKLMFSEFFSPLGEFATINPIATTFNISLLHDVFAQTFFIGLFNIQSLHSQFFLSVQANSSTLIINGKLLNAGSTANFKGFALYAYICSLGFYFNENYQTCELCPNFATLCQTKPNNQIQCLECLPNFQISADKLSCQCKQNLISSTCADFSSPSFMHCSLAFNNSQCLFCSPVKLKAIYNGKCECQSGYQDPDGDGNCQQICGDGLVFSQQCDDGNYNSNDGCSSNCKKQNGFKCENTSPSYCKSQTALVYQIKQIRKIHSQNKCSLTLKIIDYINYLPFKVKTNEFMPQQTFLKFFIIISNNPYIQQQVSVKISDISEQHEIILDFDYSFNIESLNTILKINYEQTKYFNSTQQLKFSLNGNNQVLIYSPNLFHYNSLAIALCIITALCFAIFLVSLFSSKYIGLELIIPLQLIFYSQLLIYDLKRWPVGFFYLKYLKFASGFNNIIKLTQYFPFSINTKKYNLLYMEKTIIENFNINFIILLITFIVFIIIITLKYLKQSFIIENQQKYKYILSKEEKATKYLMFEKYTKTLVYYKKINEKCFWVLNHLSQMLTLPIMAAVASDMQIENLYVKLINTSKITNTILSFSKTIALTTILIIFFTCLNNFYNIWLDLITIKKLMYKPEEILYKKLLFLYLLVMGYIILYFNNTKIFNYSISIFIFILQFIYIIMLIFINPYKNLQKYIQQHLLLIKLSIQFLYLLLILLILFNILIKFLFLFSVILQQVLLLFQQFQLQFDCITKQDMEKIYKKKFQNKDNKKKESKNST